MSKLEREVAGVERACERSQLRLVDLLPHHLAHAELHAVQSHRAVVLDVRQHEERRKVGRGFCLPCESAFGGTSVVTFSGSGDGPERHAERGLSHAERGHPCSASL